MVNNTLKSRIDILLVSLGKNQEMIKKTSIALEISKMLLEEIGIANIESPDEILYRILKLPNSERYDSWFVPHPYYGSERACFSITDDSNGILEAKFYILQKKSRSTIAGAVNFTPNWEDADYTRDSTTARIGIDFFLTPSNSLLVVLSNRGKLRIMELSDHMSNTQVEIFAIWKGAYKLTTREALHITLWDALKLESVNNKFFLGVAQSFTDLIQHLEKTGRNHEESKLFASRLHGRLLFVWFLRKKHIISNRFDYFTTEDLSSTEYYINRLSPLFFECLNTPTTERNSLDQDTPYLNGGLFDPRTDGYDWSASTVTFPEGFFDRLYNHFDQFNFTTDESTPDYEQIAIDPEMLGRIFENLLATQVEATGEQARKAKGAFYTPREIVSYMCRESLRQYLYTKFAKHESIDRLLDTSVSDWAKAGTNSRRDNYTPEDQRMIIGALDDITILDPACGSGAYPMGILQMMLQCYERMDTRYDPYQVKLQIIKNNIYGVDIEPMAVEIARLRAWLSLIVDEPSDSKNVKPLPNLDFKFVCANSLLPLMSEDGQQNMFDMKDLEDKMQDIRDKYYNARTPNSKESLKQDFQKLLQAGQQSMFVSQRENQLKTYHPFDVHNICQFFDPEFMFGIVEGFDVVIGNPPYGAKVSTDERNIYKKVYESAKTDKKGTGSTNTFVVFIDLAISKLAKRNAVVSYIVPMSITSGDSFEKLHQLMMKDCNCIYISNYSDRPKKIFDSAETACSIFIGVKKEDNDSPRIYTTKVIKRYSNDETIDSIIQNLSFVESTEYIKPGRIPKVGSTMELSILKEIYKQENRISDFKDEEGHPLYYRTSGGRYYKLITNFSTGSTKEISINVKSKYLNFIGALLSSNLFFWFYHTHSNNLDLKMGDIDIFPIIDINSLDLSVLDKVSGLYSQYINDLEKNSEIQSQTRNTTLDVKVYYARKSKHFIDEIDKIICPLYGFSEEQLQFIINYDIKFRTDVIE